MNRTFYGYERPDGKFGARNYVAIIPSVVCANEVAESIERQTVNTRCYCHHQGCCQLPPDLERVTKALIGLGLHPNVGACLIVSLGCEGTDVDLLEETLRASGKPVERVNIQEIGGMSPAIQNGIQKVQKMQMQIFQ